MKHIKTFENNSLKKHSKTKLSKGDLAKHYTGKKSNKLQELFSSNQITMNDIEEFLLSKGLTTVESKRLEELELMEINHPG